MAITDWHTSDWVKGSYIDERNFLIKVAENNPLRTGDLSGLQAHYDNGDSIAIGYGLDLLENDNSNINGYLVAAGLAPLSLQDANLLDEARAQRSAGTATAEYLISIASQLSINLGSEPNASNLLSVVVEAEYEARVDRWLEGTGIVIPDSKERAALVSLAYNGYINTGSSPNLLQAVINDDRAEAWFEIRYNSNYEPPNLQDGVAKRHYYEADLFGLYSDQVDAVNITDADAKGVYRMYTRHKEQINQYDATFSSQIVNANNDFEVTFVMERDAHFQWAKDYLIGNYGLGLIIDGDIQVGEDSSSTYYSGTDIDTLTGTDQNDLMFGESGNDILNSGLGDDVLYGGAGNDTLDGGAGYDTYVANDMDTIIDSDGLGLGQVDFNGTTLSVAERVNDQLATSDDNRYVYITRGNDLYVIDTQGAQQMVRIQDFLDGDLDINFADPAPVTGGIINGTTGNDANLIYTDLQAGIAGGKILRNTINGLSLDTTGTNLLASATTAAIYGQAGDDYIRGHLGGLPIYIDGGADNDLILADDASVTGYPGGYVVTPGEGATIDGGAGNDAITGGARNDVIDAGSGHDQVAGTIYYSVDQNDADTIYGGTGNDWLRGGAGNDVIVGGPDAAGAESDNDTLLGGEGSDYLFGGVGDDAIYGDTDGGFQRKEVYLSESTSTNSTNLGIVGWKGETQEHVLPVFNYATPTNMAILKDVPLEYAGNDILDGGEGNDKLYGGAGNDILYGRADNDKLYGEAGDDILEGGAGSDYLWGDKSVESWNNDYASLSLNTGSVTFFTRSHADEFAVVGNDTLDGGAGIDYLHGGGGNDTLNGGSDADYLYGEGDDDTLSGGTEDDYLLGGEGNDTYLFNLGDGYDAILETSGTDTVVFGDGIALSNIDIQINAGNTVIAVQGTGDILLVVDSAVENYVFADGTTLTAQDVYNNATVIFGTATANVITLGDNGTQVQAGDGDDTVNGGLGDDVIYGEVGNDTLYGNGGADFIDGESGNDTLDGGAGDDVLSGGIGNDTITGGLGNDVLYGGGGDETFIYNLGDGLDRIETTYSGSNDRVIFGSGILKENTVATYLYVGAEGQLQVRFKDSNGDLIPDQGLDIVYLPAGESAGYDPYRAYGVEYFEFADGTVWTEYDLRFPPSTNSAPVLANAPTDVTLLEATLWQYTLPADTFTDPDEGDSLTYSVTLNDGNPLPDWLSFDSTTLAFSGTPGSGDLGQITVKVTATDTSGAAASDSFNIGVKPLNGELITGTTGDDILVGGLGDDYLQGFEGNDILDAGDEGLNILDGGSGDDLLFGGYGNDRFIGGSDTDLLIGNGGDDTYVYNLGDGMDRIETTYSGSNDRVIFGADVIRQNTVATYVAINGEDLLQVRFTDSNGDLIPDQGLDIVMIPAGESIGWDPSRAYGVEYFEFADGAVLNDYELRFPPANLAPVLKTPVSDVELTENTAWQLTLPADTFFDPDAGDTLTYGLTRADGTALPSWVNFDPATFTLSGTPTSEDLGQLTVKLTATDNVGAITNDYFNIGVKPLNGELIVGTNGADTLTGGLGDDYLEGFAGNDTLNGGAGSDILDGGAGDDTFVFSSGSGIITVKETSAKSGGGSDTVLMSGLSTRDVEVSRTGNDINISITATGDQLILQGALAWDQAAWIESLYFDSGKGTTWTQADLVELFASHGDRKANTLTGTAVNDFLYGEGGDDTLDGQAGDDLLVGGQGNDTLIGDVGNDIYRFNAGDGFDLIRDTDSTPGNADVVEFDSNQVPLDIILQQQGNDLLASYNDGVDQVTIENWYSGDANQIEKFVASDGSTLSNSQVDQLIQAMATFSADNGGITWEQAIQDRPTDVQAILTSYWQPTA